MDTLTHALSGALLARAVSKQDIPRRVAAGFLACAAPDLDIVYAFAGPMAYLEHHRAASHSILMLPFWAALVAWLLAKLLREPGGWRALYGVCAMSIGLHIAGDLITGYGTMALAPFSDWRAALGTTFIIDLWFSGIILAGLVASIFAAKSRLPAVASLAVLACYVGFQYLEKQKALELGAQYAKENGLKDANVSAHPRPPTPFNWTVFVSDEAAHRFANINLYRREPKTAQPDDGLIARLDAQYRPPAAALWTTRPRYGEANPQMVREAWESPALSVFRWFAELPAFDGASAGSECYWFVDLRFMVPGRDGATFRYAACRDRPGAPWRLRTSE